MLLKDKNAIVYGAAGSVGGTVAQALAAEGARVILAGRNAAPLAAIAEKIEAEGGTADVATVDALDEAAVEAHADAAGPIDISFNAISLPQTGIQGTRADAYGITRAQFEARMADRMLSKRLPTIANIADAATFLASDHAAALTGTVLNLSSGMVIN